MFFGEGTRPEMRLLKKLKAKSRGDGSFGYTCIPPQNKLIKRNDLLRQSRTISAEGKF